MHTHMYRPAALLLLSRLFAFGQGAPTVESRTPQPLYQVTIVSRTTKALNYGYLTAPTRIDFKGTPVLSHAQGEAVVEPKRGSTLLKMRFKDVPPPTRFGAQYLTYVVWAISPDGRAQNLGELDLDGSDKGKLTTSTPLQTFAMIVTAEPYFSVTQPSDIVVMENMVGPGTVGKIQEVNATYELLPRKPFTYDMNAQPKASDRLVGKQEYEATVALYQALNAIQIAQSQGADRYAPEQMTRARAVYNKARGYPVNLSKEIVSLAREATQIAEDSRAIATRRAEAERLAQEAGAAAQSTGQERSRGTRPPPATAPPPAPAPVPEARSPRPIAPASQDAPTVEVDHNQFLRNDLRAMENRRRLLAALPRTFEIVDSPRGLMLTLPEQASRSGATLASLSTVAAALKPYKDLHIEVGGHTDAGNAVTATERDAENVRKTLVDAGVSPDIIAVRGYGNTRLRTSNATIAGRNQNRRIEIVIAGDAIGSLPTWDRSYSLRP
jgi:outer membrane protein OmpA-like peptidoglycan-associated protein